MRIGRSVSPSVTDKHEINIHSWIKFATVCRMPRCIRDARGRAILRMINELMYIYIYIFDKIYRYVCWKALVVL